MGYTTSSVSRRMVMVKVKTRPGARKKALSGPRPDETRSTTRVEKADVVPLLFARTARTVPTAAPAPVWKTWMTISLVAVVSAALLIGIYAMFVGRRAGEDPAAARKTWASLRSHANSARSSDALDPLNPRAMKYTDGRSPGVGGAIAGATGSASPAQPGGPDLRGRRSDPLSDEDNPLLLDGRKLVLPADVSGSCEIGERGLGDLGACLARNGARSQ